MKVLNLQVIDEMISKVRNWESIWQSGTRSFFLILVKSSDCMEFFGIHQFMHLGITFEFDSMFEGTLHPLSSLKPLPQTLH